MRHFPQVGERLAGGSFGNVWEATVMTTGTDGVVKVPFPDPDLDGPEACRKYSPPSKSVRESFAREIQLLAAVQHPHIVKMLGATADMTCIVLELAKTDLYCLVKKLKLRTSIATFKEWSRQILGAVAFLHENSVMHRDLKSANVLVYPNNAVKLCDFGLATRDMADVMEVRREMTTVWYRAPELLMGDKVYTPRIDEWSAGCVLLEILCGGCVLPGKTSARCQCGTRAHCNYNSDQLVQVFKLIGTPTERAYLSRMQCIDHFKSWPLYPSRLRQMIAKAVTQERCSAQHPEQVFVEDDANARGSIRAGPGVDAAAVSSEIADMFEMMLCYDPQDRRLSRAVLRHPFFDSGPPKRGGSRPITGPSPASQRSAASGVSDGMSPLARTGGGAASLRLSSADAQTLDGRRGPRVSGTSRAPRRDSLDVASPASSSSMMSRARHFMRGGSLRMQSSASGGSAGRPRSRSGVAGRCAPSTSQLHGASEHPVQLGIGGHRSGSAGSDDRGFQAPVGHAVGGRAGGGRAQAFDVLSVTTRRPSVPQPQLLQRSGLSLPRSSSSISQQQPQSTGDPLAEILKARARHATFEAMARNDTKRSPNRVRMFRSRNDPGGP